MIIRNIGNSLSHILPELISQDISSVFDMTRPLIEFKFASVGYENNLAVYTYNKNVINGIPLVSGFLDIETDQQHFRARVAEVYRRGWRW